MNPKSKLLVVREGPQTILAKLFKAWNISHLVFEKDTDSYARERDEDIMQQAKKAGVEVIVKTGRTLFDMDDLIKENGGKPTMSMSQVEHAAEGLGGVPKPIPAPKELPDPGDTSLKGVGADPPEAKPDFNEAFRESEDKSYEKLAGPKGDFAPPTVEELGMPKPATPHRGGETKALEALDKIIKDKEYTATFAKPNTAPTAFQPQSTTLLSPHHHFGSLSVRLFYWRVQEVLDSYPKAKQTTIPTNLHGQILFRDMYFGAQHVLGHSFSQNATNKTNRFIPWHLPSKLDPKTHIKTGQGYDVDSAEAEEWFIRWREGRTGFPWIDAVMRQLRSEGWIHHLARHAVACFLTRGGCYIHWERGLEVFEEFLIDHEPACNSGNWQWLSCTAFFAQFYRCYSPIAFPKKTDKDGEYVRHYVPELADIPTKYIYEPWKTPIPDQKKAGVLIKGDGTQEKDESGKLKLYPKPMFDFNERRQICIDGVKQAYDMKLYGDDPRVLDGSWCKLFPDSAEGPTDGSGAGGKRKRGTAKDGDDDDQNDEDKDGDENEDDGEDEEDVAEENDKVEEQEAKIAKSKNAGPSKGKAGGRGGGGKKSGGGQGTLDSHLSNGGSKGGRGRGKRSKA